MYNTSALSMTIQTMLTFAIPNKGVAARLHQQHVRKILPRHHARVLIIHHVWAHNLAHDLRREIRLIRMIDDRRRCTSEKNIGFTFVRQCSLCRQRP